MPNILVNYLYLLKDWEQFFVLYTTVTTSLRETWLKVTCLPILQYLLKSHVAKNFFEKEKRFVISFLPYGEIYGNLEQ